MPKLSKIPNNAHLLFVIIMKLANFWLKIPQAISFYNNKNFIGYRFYSLSWGTQKENIKDTVVDFCEFISIYKICVSKGINFFVIVIKTTFHVTKKQFLWFFFLI